MLFKHSDWLQILNRILPILIKRSHGQGSTVEKYKDLGMRARRFDAPWPPEILQVKLGLLRALAAICTS